MFVDVVKTSGAEYGHHASSMQVISTISGTPHIRKLKTQGKSTAQILGLEVVSVVVKACGQ